MDSLRQFFESLPQKPFGNTLETFYRVLRDSLRDYLTDSLGESLRDSLRQSTERFLSD